MTETSKYLSTLAKVMRNKNSHVEGHNKEKYDRLYYLIHSELNSKLKQSMYPNTSDIYQRTEYMLDAIEPMYLCPEVVGKRCLWVSCYITTNMFQVCNSLFTNQEFVSIFKKVYTQIPLLVVDTDSVDMVEVINFANIRIPLSISELKFLIIESGRRKIALNKIIQIIIVNTKLNDSSICIISDNIYSNAEKIFSRALSGRLVYVNEDGVKSIEHRSINLNSSLLLSDEVFEKAVNNSYIKKYKKVLFSEIIEYVKNEVKPVLYGFWEEYISIETQILDFYDNKLRQSKETLKEVVGDIVRIGNSGDRTLQSIRVLEESREKKLESEKQSIESTLKCIEEIVTEICDDLGEIFTSGKNVSRKTFDDIFVSFFRCEEFSSGLGKKLLSRLYSYEYDNYDLVNAYVQVKTGIGLNYELIDIDSHEWEKAKMLIYVQDLEKIPNSKLKLYLSVLGNHCSTGKEFFAKAFICSENEKQDILKESLRRGYEKAGIKLLNMYKCNPKGVNIQTLANALIPEACMILADQNMARYQNRRRFADLSNREFTYYKIAAANQYLPAVGKIVDMVFESRFSSGFQIPENEIGSSNYEEMIDNGHVICQLCHFLISKMYNSAHYSEILGIILFCLNEDLSGAMSLLTNSKSALALYCKGNMYEFGGGVAMDLDEAINNYELSLKKRYSQRTEKRLTACCGKKSRNIKDSVSDNYYQKSRIYSSSINNTSSSTEYDGCFAPGTKILMSDRTYRYVDDININDYVLVFDHYTGKICKEKIVANVHEVSGEIKTEMIMLIFENEKKLYIVKSHALYNISLNQYVWIDVSNVEKYVGDGFAYFSNGKIESEKLTAYSIEMKYTKYYMPISRYHLNVFAEGILTMPPTKITLNMFRCKEDMRYDTSPIHKYGITKYDDIQHLVSYEEYIELPCKYLKAVCETKKLSINDFIVAMNLFRDQEKYRKTES